MAIGALRAARERGATVPGTLAVVGMDDIEMSAYLEPPLTTVRVEKEAMGRLAAECLIALIEGTGTSPGAAAVPIDLIVRGTCGGLATTAPRAGATEGT
jgi:DNA-binding LacI/PurR family transcriptional regulator